MKFAHVALWTRDLDGAAEFWRRYFEAEVGSDYRSTRRPGFVSRFAKLPGSEVEVELMTAPWLEARVGGEAIGWDHVAVSLGSREAVDSLAARCEAEDALASKPRMTGDGFYEAVLRMPDGTLVEITS
ncbi:lactoylglutathione lyase [Bosea sp. AK1]|uniref:VOC family protein n=1 Tax=Bosea sp. AK1 TaxID=2587160 RepID=UPI00114ECF4A|nr:VOC family protein [Bosea sp. AK1]TQI65307.1 lactoylglutathione lyase [Bosea sp. AK1]